MRNVATETTPVARKEYHCDGMALILDCGLDGRDFTNEEWQTIKRVQQDGGKIMPGMRYRKVAGIFDGEGETFRVRPDIDKILVENCMYADE